MINLIQKVKKFAHLQLNLYQLKSLFKNSFYSVFVLSLITIGLLSFANKASAATIYVSNSATNGYAVGNDSNTYAQAQNKATPYLTLTKATSSSVSNGDTIVINDGIYNEIAAVITARYGLTITNDSVTGVLGGVIIRAASGTARVLHLNQNGGTTQTYTLGPIVLDANNAQDSCLTIDSINDIANLVINGTQFLNPKLGWISAAGHLQNLTMSGNWTATANTSAAGGFNGFYLNGSATNPGIYSISNGTITQTNIGGTSSTYNHGFNFEPATSGLIISLSGVTINKTAGATGGTLYGIYSIGAGNPSLTLNNVNYNFTGASTIMYGVVVNGQVGLSITGGSYTYSGASATMRGVSGTNLASFSMNGGTFAYTGGPTRVSAVEIYEGASITTSCLIHSLTGDLGSPYGNGYLIMVGSDGDPGASANHITNPRVYNNNLSSSNHGILLGYVTGGAVYNNITDQTVIGVISKYSTNNVYYNNIIKNVTTGGALRAKGGTGTSFYNNTVTLGAYGVGEFTTDGALSNTFKNNIIYTTESNFQFVSVLSNSSVLNNNGYYSTQVLPYNAWQNSSTNYATLLLWQGAGFDTSPSFNANPLFISSSDYRLQPASPAINAGTDVSLASDYLGNPIVSIPDIGAYEFQAPASPTALSQYKADGTTVITSGSFTNESIVVLKLNMSSSVHNSSDLLTPQIEIQESDIPFTNTVTNSGDAVSYSDSDVTGIVTVTGLTSGKTYHWQARTSNPATQSTWVTMGGNPDFTVDTTAPSSPISFPTTGTYSLAQSVSLKSDGSNFIRYSTIEIPSDCSSGTLYSSPIEISSSQTIYVRACDTLNNSSISSFSYVISKKPQSTSTGSSVAVRYNNLIALGKTLEAENLKKEFPNQIQTQQQKTETQSEKIILSKLLKISKSKLGEIEVKYLQQFLNSKGFGNLIVDGKFGLKTKKAVILFQKTNSLTPDGIVGPRTRMIINSME